jgi:hypothetical protein
MGQAIKDVVGFGLAGVTGGASLLLGTERNENVSSPRLIERQESKKAEQTCMSPAPTRVGALPLPRWRSPTSRPRSRRSHNRHRVACHRCPRSANRPWPPPVTPRRTHRYPGRRRLGLPGPPIAEALVGRSPACLRARYSARRNEGRLRHDPRPIALARADPAAGHPVGHRRAVVHLTNRRAPDRVQRRCRSIAVAAIVYMVTVALTHRATG